MARIIAVVTLIAFLMVGCSPKKEVVANKQAATLFDTTKLIDVTDEAFSEWYDKLNTNANSATGVKLRIRGQIVADAGGVSGMKMLSRQMTKGCSHSISRIGFLSNGAGVNELADSTWILATVRVKADSVLMYRDAPKVFMPVFEVEKFLFSIAPVNPVIGMGPGASCGSEH
ncbi:MAG: hypothetical protein JNL74_17655 [Fibrobacteres bacterium]|nr:hypothetical protein [Fibrobacterota bacterium]